MVTATALSNLLSAVAKNDKCSRVCLVITDLANSYKQGSAIISQVLSNLNNETQRTAMDLEPVRLNSDELYHILRTRMFESLPNETEISQVAAGYAQAIRNAKQMSITTESPEEFAGRINLSYPFHPGIRDLYARFRGERWFSTDTRLIRLMRIVTSRMWNNGTAASSYLIAAHDIDLNDQETRTEISQINNSLDNAIAHDLAMRVVLFPRSWTRTWERVMRQMQRRCSSCHRSQTFRCGSWPYHPRAGCLLVRTRARPFAIEVGCARKAFDGSLVSP